MEWFICEVCNIMEEYVHLELKASLPGGSDGKASACNAGGPSSILGSGRSPGEGNGNPLQYSCLENSMDWGTWWATVHGVTKNWARLSNFAFKSETYLYPFPELTTKLLDLLDLSLMYRRKMGKTPPTSKRDWQVTYATSKTILYM